MEVTTAIGVISFALVALLGVFPLGLENGRMSVAETRGSQLVRMVTATLVSEPFDKAPCFAEGTPLNFGEEASWPGPGKSSPAQNAKGLAETPPVVLYASYDSAVPGSAAATPGRENPQIVRAAKAPEGAIYRIEVRFSPETMPGATTSSSAPAPASSIRVVGTTALIRVTTMAGETGLNWQELMAREKSTAKRRKGLVLETQTFIPAFSRTIAAQ